MVGINQKITVSRFMDNREKTDLRKEYQDILELKMPLVEKELQQASYEYEKAKKALADAKEMVNATTNTVKALANEVKLGIKDITLDDNYTWRVPFEGKYYFYTFMDLQLKLAKVSIIPDYEKTDLYNSMTTNEEFFHGNFGTSEEIKAWKTKPKTKFIKVIDKGKDEPALDLKPEDIPQCNPPSESTVKKQDE